MEILHPIHGDSMEMLHPIHGDSITSPGVHPIQIRRLHGDSPSNPWRLHNLSWIDSNHSLESPQASPGEDPIQIRRLHGVSMETPI